jgi:cell division protein FtsX
VSIGHGVLAVLRRAARIAVERPRAAMWATLVLTCALFALAVAGVAALALDRAAAARPGSTATMVVYLGEGVVVEDARSLAAELAQLSGVERVELVAPEASARRLIAALGQDPAVLDGVDVESLPASVEVTLAPGVRDVVAMSPTVQALRDAPGVADVVVDDPVEDQLAGTLAGVRALAWWVVAGLAGLAIVAVLVTTRLQLDRERRELAVAELLGAGPSFVVIPTAIAGALHGVVAALLAITLLAITLATHGGALGDAVALGDALDPELVLPDLATLIGLAGAGGLLGLLGGGLAGAHHHGRTRCGGLV